MIRVCTLCSGYDSQMMAMKRLEKDFGLKSELVAWSEIDEIPIKAHDALFPESKGKNLGDMTKINWENVADFDLLTYSTPCTSISAQGRQEGFKKDSGTASSIIWYTEECIRVKRPKYLLLENVKAMVSKRYEEDFKAWLGILESYGYTNYYKVLNAKDYDIPQNRERVFVVSILNGDLMEYQFPTPIKPTRCLTDMLEPIDKRWIYNKKYVEHFHYFDNNKLINKSKDWSIRPIGNMFESDYNSGNVYDATTRVCKTISPTCMVHHGTSVILERLDENGESIIVKMTPREMFKLMGVSGEDIDTIEKTCGSSGLLKMAGNSIVVDVLYHIFRQLFVKES